MAHKTATIYINVKTDEGKWKFYRPALKQNGRIREGWAVVNDQPVQFEDFNYYVSWYQDGKKKFENCGKDPDVAVAGLSRKESALAAKNEGLTVLEENTEGRVLVKDAIATYLADAKDKAPGTYKSRKRTMELFAASCNKTFMDQIDTRDMLDFRSFLRKQKVFKSTRLLGDRTVFNHFEGANSFLRANGIKDIVPDHEWPRFDEKVPKKYQPEELTKLFSVCGTFQKRVFTFFLTSGGREAEVARLMWKDIDFKGKKVQFVSREGASTKNRKSRTVPLPDATLAMLKEHQKEYGDSLYVFPNGQGGMEGHFLRILKELAFRAGLNCGHCKNVGEGRKQNCKEHAVCGEVELHRLRKTCATTWLHGKIHIRKIQKWLGHHSLDVTLAYLADEDESADPVREEVNGAFAAFA